SWTASLVCGHPTRQDNLELGKFVWPAVHGQLPSMLLHDDVVAKRQAEPGAFSGGLGSEKRFENLVSYFIVYSGAIVAHANFHLAAQVARTDTQRRLETLVLDGVGAHARGIDAVADQVQHHPEELLWERIDRAGSRIDILLHRDVEPRRLRARTMIGEIQRLLDGRVHIDRTLFARAGSGMQQHVLDDAVRPPAMLGDLLQVALQRGCDVVDFGAQAVSDGK